VTEAASEESKPDARPLTDEIHLYPCPKSRRHLYPNRHGPVSNNRTGELDNTITPDSVYKLVRRHALALGLKFGATRCAPPPRTR